MECDVGAGFNTYITPAHKHTCELVQEHTHTHTNEVRSSLCYCKRSSKLCRQPELAHSFQVFFGLPYSYWPCSMFHLFVLSYSGQGHPTTD